MKNVIYVVFIALAIMQVSCVSVRAGAAFGSERSSSSFSERPASKSAESVSSSQLNISGSQNLVGFYVGAYTDIDLSDNMGVQPEVDFVWFDSWKMFQVPVLLNYEFFEGFKGYAGPNVTLLVDRPATLDSFGFGLDAGVSYSFSNKFSIEARYDYGLTDYSNVDGFEVKFSHFQVGAAYRFGE
ncbi:MAG: PorT family protein [Urechidicola sp.]|nr:PorT family protein [Urechidicola sp.]